jgi:single-strand DNA-binding protein
MTSPVSSRTGLNQVILTGKVANDPQFHFQPDGTPVLRFPLELNDSGDLPSKPSGRDRREQASKRTSLRPSLIQIVALGQVAEVRSGLRTGQHLLVIGRLNQRRWQTPQGRSRTVTEVIASELQPDEEKEATLNTSSPLAGED